MFGKKATILTIALLSIATVASADAYIELASNADLNGGNADLTSHTMTVYSNGVAYSHMAKTSLPRDFAITATTFAGGVPSSGNLTTLASWTTDVGAPASDRIFTGYGSAVVGNSLQIVNSNNGDGEGVFRIDLSTGTVSSYLTEAQINTAIGTTNADIQNWSGVSPTGEAVFYEGSTDSILESNGAGNVVTLVTAAELSAAQGNIYVNSGLEYDNAGNLYWGNNSTEGLYMRDASGTITEVISATDLEALLDLGSYSGAMFFAPDNQMYFRYNSSILTFDPAAADPAATLEILLTKDELLAGPAANASVGQFSWYEGQLAWTTFTGGYYTIPEPASLCLLALGGVMMCARRR